MAGHASNDNLLLLCTHNLLGLVHQGVGEVCSRNDCSSKVSSEKPQQAGITSAYLDLIRQTRMNQDHTW